MFLVFCVVCGVLCDASIVCAGCRVSFNHRPNLHNELFRRRRHYPVVHFDAMIRSCCRQSCATRCGKCGEDGAPCKDQVTQRGLVQDHRLRHWCSFCVPVSDPVPVPSSSTLQWPAWSELEHSSTPVMSLISLFRVSMSVSVECKTCLERWATSS